MRGWIIALLFLVGAGAEAAPLACLQGFEVKAHRRPVGLETIHRTASSVITVFVPMPAGDEGHLEDINALAFGEGFPQRFSFGDGSLKTAFVDVDFRAGSRLRKCVAELADRFREGEGNETSRLVHFLDDYLDPVPEDFRFPWEPARDPELPPEFTEAADLPVGHFPIATKLTLAEVPLEAFLQAKRGVCVQRVLLLSLLMDELGLPHRVRAGGTDGGGGHVWIELPDGRHLDPTWHLLEKPNVNGAAEGWFRIDKTYLFRNQVFPVAVDS